MGGSKKQTVGYKYYLGEHMVLCHGPIDSFSRIKVGDKVAWEGLTTGGQIYVNNPSLFGGDEREGGVSGLVDFEMGGPTQGQNSYLVAKCSPEVPGFRGVAAAVLRQCYLGNNPYLKAWEFRGTRIHTRQGGAGQWYDERSEIPSSGAITGTVTVSWKQNTFIQPGGNDESRMGIGFIDVNGNLIGSITWSPYAQPTSWTLRSVYAIAPAGAVRIRVYMGMQRLAGSYCDGYIDDIHVALNGVPVAVVNSGAEAGNTSGWTNDTGAIAVALGGSPSTGGSFPLAPEGSYFFTGGFSATAIAYQEVSAGGGDMNPAHIIRECLTDPDWGMGYTDDDIDEDTFIAVADTLYSEGMGISLLWDRQSRLEDFIGEIVKHIDGSLYVSRTTGKFVLKLARADFDPDDLIHLDESNIIKIEDPARPTIGELVNSVSVKFWDSVTGTEASITLTDPALVQMQGSVINTTIQYPGFTNARNATIAGQRDLRTLSSSLFSCMIYANNTGRSLNVGDPFKMSWAKWNIADQVMRVTAIALGDGKSGTVRISCVEDMFSTETTLQVIGGGGTEWVDPSGPPDPAEDAIVFEAPYYELTQRLGQTLVDSQLATNPEIGRLMAAASPVTSAINARIYADDGSGFTDQGSLDFCPTAALTSDIGPTDTTVPYGSGSNLEDVTIGSFFQLGDEICRIDAIHPLTTTMDIGRGCLDTVPNPHVLGDVIYFWDELNGYDETEYVSGEELDAKIITTSGFGNLALADAPILTMTMAGRASRPYPPGDLRIQGQSYEEDAAYDGELAISWTHRDRTMQTGGTIYDHTFGDIGPEVGTTYRLRGYMNGALIHTEDDIAGSSTTWTPGVSGQAEVFVDDKRDGIYSWQAAHHSFTYLSDAARITEADDNRITEGGDFMETED